MGNIINTMVPKFKKGTFIKEKDTNDMYRIVLVEWDSILRWLYHCEPINNKKIIYIFDEDSIELA